MIYPFTLGIRAGERRQSDGQTYHICPVSGYALVWIRGDPFFGKNNATFVLQIVGEIHGGPH
jgi:hypothetical protein